MGRRASHVRRVFREGEASMTTTVRDTRSSRRAAQLRRAGKDDWTTLAPGYFSKNSAASTARRIKCDLIEGWAVHGPWDARVRKDGRRFFVQVKPADASPVPAVVPDPVVEPAIQTFNSPASGVWVEVNGQRVRIDVVA